MNQCGTNTAKQSFVVRCQAGTYVHVSHSRRGRQCAAMHALQMTFGGEFAQIASYCVLGNTQLFAEGLGDELPSRAAGEGGAA